MIGSRFGRLIVTAAAGTRRQPSGIVRKLFHCRCDCGKELVIFEHNLRRCNTQSCGCLRLERLRISRLDHGDTVGRKNTPEYNSWKHLTGRCQNPNNAKFKDYGGRGIKVCARWLESYSNFLADMGRKPTPQHSIDRKDNDGNYEPGNCRWATRKEQRKNIRPRSEWAIGMRGSAVPGARTAKLAVYALSFGS